MNNISYIGGNVPGKSHHMYYLIVRNLGAPRCIDSSEKDIYEDGMSFDCSPHLDCTAKEFIKEVEITCTEHPEEGIVAMVFRD